jgi:hypothetical protein
MQVYTFTKYSKPGNTTGETKMKRKLKILIYNVAKYVVEHLSEEVVLLDESRLHRDCSSLCKQLPGYLAVTTEDLESALKVYYTTTDSYTSTSRLILVPDNVLLEYVLNKEHLVYIVYSLSSKKSLGLATLDKWSDVLPDTLEVKTKGWYGCRPVKAND